MVTNNELLIKRRNTLAYIKANPVKVIMNRSVKVTSASGGKIASTPTAVRPQLMRLVAQRRDWSAKLAGLTQDRAIDDEYILIGLSDADVQLRDTFSVRGWDYEVKTLMEPNGYSTLAGCGRQRVTGQ